MVRRALCPDCRYDLRASTGRCPECGRGIGLGSLAVGRVEATALTVLVATPPATLVLLALLGVFSKPPAPATPSRLAAGLMTIRDPQLLYLRQWTPVRLTWVDESYNETGFTIERRAENGSLQYMTCQPNETELMDQNLRRGMVYEYRVIATHDFGSSAPSNVARITAPP